MTASLTWPGDHRAGPVFSDAALLTAMVRVESAWLDALVATGLAPAVPGIPSDAAGPDDVTSVADASESGGNPAIPLLALLRSRSDDRTAAWLHRGLTSQDVVDTAVMLCVRDAVTAVRTDLDRQLAALAGLVDTHRRTPMVGRTLTRHAIPITFGGKAAGWAAGVLDAADDLDALTFPAQFGGAAGTSAAAVELARGTTDPVRTAAEIAARAVTSLGLDHAAPWQTARAPVTRAGDALAGCTDACARIANDVLVLSRPELGELREPSGGGSSTMPQKANPVLSVLIRRAGLAAPALAATLHLAAAGTVDERADGAWHVEWATLQTLARRTVTAAAQTADLLAGLEVDPDRMAATLTAALPDVLAERRSTNPDAGDDPLDYLGATDALIDGTLARIADRSSR